MLTCRNTKPSVLCALEGTIGYCFPASLYHFCSFPDASTERRSGLVYKTVERKQKKKHNPSSSKSKEQRKGFCADFVPRLKGSLNINPRSYTRSIREKKHGFAGGGKN